MSGRDAIQLWKALLVLVTLGVHLHGQSALKSSSWIPNPDGNKPAGHSFAYGIPEIDLHPDDGPTDPRTFPNNSNLYGSLDFAVCCRQTVYSKPWSSSRSPISGSGTDPAGIAQSEDRQDGRAESPSRAVVRPNNQPELDGGVYYRNRLEFAFDAGWLPINIPFVFDVFLGDAYTRAPLDYTLVPLVASLRWHMNDVAGPWIFRGNWDMTVSGSITVIPRGPETRYFSYDMGIRRNFVPRRGKIAPYFDGRLGLGQIDAKEPLGVQFAQGQNFTFTMNMGAGARYNFNSRYSLSAGLNWMHISNLYLSEPAFSNYGINVYGPMFGIDIRLGKPRHASK
jgi:hypothetical protein